MTIFQAFAMRGWVFFLSLIDPIFGGRWGALRNRLRHISSFLKSVCVSLVFKVSVPDI